MMMRRSPCRVSYDKRGPSMRQNNDYGWFYVSLQFSWVVTQQPITETTSIMQSISTNFPLHMIRLSCILAPKPKYIGTTKAKGQDGKTRRLWMCVCGYATICNLIPPCILHLSCILERVHSMSIILRTEKRQHFTPTNMYTHTHWKIGALLWGVFFVAYIVDIDCSGMMIVYYPPRLSPFSNRLHGEDMGEVFAWILIYQRYHELFMHCLLSFELVCLL